MTVHDFKLDTWSVELKIIKKFSWVPTILNNRKVLWLRSYWVIASDYTYQNKQQNKQFSRVIFSGQSQAECSNKIIPLLK